MRPEGEGKSRAIFPKILPQRGKRPVSIKTQLNHSRLTRFEYLSVISLASINPRPARQQALRQKILQYMAMYVRQPEIPPLEPVGQPFMVNSQQVHHCRLKIMHMNRLFCDVNP